jgi:hypothetical protein
MRSLGYGGAAKKPRDRIVKCAALNADRKKAILLRFTMQQKFARKVAGREG